MNQEKYINKKEERTVGRAPESLVIASGVKFIKEAIIVVDDMVLKQGRGRERERGGNGQGERSNVRGEV